MVTDLDYLYDLAQEILDAAADSLVDDGLAVPDKVYVSPGAIADFPDDCPDQLAVHLQRVYSGIPGTEVASPEDCGFARTAEFVVRLVRCLDSSDDDEGNPSSAALDADAHGLLQDGWSLHQGLLSRYAAGTFLSACQALVVGNLTSVGPQGGLGGWQLLVQAQIEGT